MLAVRSRLFVPLGLACVAAMVAGGPVSSDVSRSAEWPQWRGPKRDAVVQESGLLTRWSEPGPPLAWKTSGLGAGFSSVAIAGGRVFTMGDLDGAQNVIALDLAGKRLWAAKVGPSFEHDSPGPRGTPTVDGELLYAIGTDGDLVCLETASGRERWRKSFVRDFGGRMMSSWKFSESPLVDGNKLVFTPGGPDAGLAAVDKQTGKEIWRSAIPALGPKGKDGAAYSSIVVSEGGGVRQYVQLIGRGLVGVRASDGRFLWGYNRVANDVANISTPIAAHHFVFASTGYQTGSVLLELSRAAEGGVSTREVYFLDGKTLQNHHGGLVLIGNYIYGGQGHRMGLPICVEFLSGKVAWGGDICNAGRGSAAVLYADGHLYFRYENGLVLLIEATPEGYREKGSFTIPGVSKPSWSHLAIAGGKLYAREQDALYVYDVRKE